MKLGIFFLLIASIIIYLLTLVKVLNFEKENYLYKLKGDYKDYLKHDLSDADRHELVSTSTFQNHEQIQNIINNAFISELLVKCNGKIIIGYKQNRLVSIGYPVRIRERCGTGKPLIVIPIIQHNIDSIEYRFQDIDEK